MLGGSVETTPTPAEYTVFKGFSEVFFVFGVGVAHKNKCGLNVIFLLGKVEI